MLEQRISKRYPLRCELRVFSSDDPASLGILGDLTLEGFMMITPHSFEKGKTYFLSLELPQEIDHKNIISFQADCRDFRPDPENAELQNVGFEFNLIQPEDLSIVDFLIQRFGSPDQ